MKANFSYFICLYIFLQVFSISFKDQLVLILIRNHFLQIIFRLLYIIYYVEQVDIVKQKKAKREILIRMLKIHTTSFI